MTPGTLIEVLRHLRELTETNEARELTDAELLERFTARREDAAFAALMHRHGPMVWAVCRRVLRDPHQAEDAFQATFLVLVRRAGAIRKADSVASWLHGVAYRAAIKARARAAATHAQERRFTEMPRPDPADELTWLELRAVLDEELGRLPEKYRTPVVLCYLEGQTHDEAARQLGCPRTSLSSRLVRARALLHERLTRRGLALSAGVLATLLAERAASAEVPAMIMLSAVRAAAHFAGRSAAGAASDEAIALAEALLKTMSTTKLTAVLALVLLLSGFAALGLTQPPPPEPSPSPPVEPAAPAPREEELPSLFHDMTPQSGLDFTYRNGEEADQYTILESLGGGVALIDYDGDGLLDIFLPGGGAFAGEDKQQIKGHPCKLFKNLGGWKFKDVTRDVGLDKIAFYTHGCAVADYDRDGWPDLLVTGYGKVALFHNAPDGKGGRRFVDVSREAGLDDTSWSTSVAWADLDGDGYPDLYICNYVDWSFAKHPTCTYDGKTRDICPPKNFNALPHKVYRNKGDGTFIDVSKEAGLRTDGQSKGLGVVVADVDGDGKPDVFVANDDTDKFLYMNRSKPGQIRFEDVSLAAGVARDDNGAPNGSRGLAVGDYDNSGRPSVFVTNYENERHALYHNDSRDGLVRFRYVTQVAGLTRMGHAYVGWGAGFFDLDHDGWPDLFIANGHVLRHPVGKAKVAQRPVLLRNEGGKFIDIAEQGGPYFQGDHRARGVAFGDLDNDGRIDLVISHINEPVVLLRNAATAGSNHWLGVELVGKKFGDVTGARLTLEVQGLPSQTRYATAGGSFASASDPRHVFGIGTAKRVGKLTVRWPSGQEQSWDGLAVDRYWRLVEGEKDARPSGARAGGK